MWSSRKQLSNCSKSLSGQVLLAHNHRRCKKNIVHTCDTCQRFASKPHAPAAKLTPIPLAWPFAQWGLDMVGKLHKSWPGGHVYLLVAVD